MDFIVKPVLDETDLELFLDVPYFIYKNDPHWVAPIRSSIKKQLQLANNPFWEYGKFQGFIALNQDQQPVGRIVAAVNDKLIEREQENIGLFGYFECVENYNIAQSLLQSATDWLKQFNISKIRGPINLSTHNDCLFLIDGFDSQPLFMMPYNPKYYVEFMIKDNWQKAKDAFAYNFLADISLDNKFEKGYQIACKSGIKFRPINTKGEDFDRDVKQIYELFTTAFANNWSSTPRSEAEFLEEAKDLKDLIDPDIFPVAEYNGEMVGFFMALPDYNIPLKKVNGKLDWWGIIKFLWNKRKINQARVIAICSLPEYRRKMLPLGLIYLGMKGGKMRGKSYQGAELSWVWEDNFPSRKLIEASGGKIYKTYRIYEKSIIN
jgi:hypothetical protein